MNIPLGFEVGTGVRVNIPLRHTAVTGQTQESGKTTTLEALITRSGLRAVCFVTKRGEKSFSTGRAIMPYFRESADWQFVESILEATMRERMKFQRSWIMKICQAYSARDGSWPKPKTLEDVARNIEIAMVKARGINEGVYRELGEYLRIVIPQIKHLPKTGTVDLQPGINVMWLEDYTLEMQALIIRSVLEWITERETHTVTVIPEAWQMLRQDRSSPVLLACEHLIRQGAANQNYIWLDSQDIAGVHKSILRQVGVWILGVQREIHETERTLDHLPAAAARKLKAADVMTLGKGQFFVAYGDDIKKSYVWPLWLDANQACLVAVTGQKPPARPTKFQASEDDMFRERAEKAEKELESCKAQLATAQASIRTLEETIDRLQDSIASAAQVNSPAEEFLKNNPPLPPQFDDKYVLSLWTRLRQVIGDDPHVIALLTSRPEIQVSVQRQTIQLSDETLKGRVALLLSQGFFDQGATGYQVWQELQRRGNGSAKPNVYTACAELCSWGFLLKEANGDSTNFVKVPGLKVTQYQIANG